MDIGTLRSACKAADLEMKEANDGAGTFLVRPKGIKGPWFSCGPAHHTHPFLLSGLSDALTEILEHSDDACKFWQMIHTRDFALTDPRKRIEVAMELLS